jgi:hypothetical protein
MGLGEKGSGLYGAREVEGREEGRKEGRKDGRKDGRKEGTKRRHKNASELNPTFGLDCMEETREVSCFISRDLEWFRLCEQKFSFLVRPLVFRASFTLSNRRSRGEIPIVLNVASCSLSMNGFWLYNNLGILIKIKS